MPDHNTHREDEGPEAPERLKQALTELRNEHILVPSQVDDAVMGAARRHLRARTISRPGWSGLPSWAAMAASFALVAGLACVFFKPSPDRTLTREDINHDGRVDVLDAFALVRQIERGEKGLRDVNGDGVVDRRDAEAIARQAVRLEKGGPS